MAKKIPLKTLEVEGSELPFSFVEQLIAFTSMGIGGAPMQAEEMLEAFPIVEELKAHQGADSIVLEDAAYRFVRARVDGGKYPALHDHWVDFINTVRDAETVKIAEVREAS